MTESLADSVAVISDQLRAPLIAEKREAGVVIRRGDRFIALSDSELTRLIEFARNPARLQVFKASGRRP
jgi:hypothetical protein